MIIIQQIRQKSQEKSFKIVKKGEKIIFLKKFQKRLDFLFSL